MNDSTPNGAMNESAPPKIVSVYALGRAGTSIMAERADRLAARVAELEAEAERLAEELLVARGEAARLRVMAAILYQRFRYEVWKHNITTAEAAEWVAKSLAAEALRPAALAPPAPEGGAA